MVHRYPGHNSRRAFVQAVLEDNPAFSKTTVYNALQALDACGLIIPVTIDSGRIPVSYTHLDVYKRQGWSCRGRPVPQIQ